jgi:putative PEP-CTERM system TPR-repeat lipoprotein
MINRISPWTPFALLVVLFATLALQGCNRDTPEKFIASGKAYLEKRDFPAAVIQFKNAVQKDPDAAEPRYLLGIALEEGEDLVSAEIELRKALSAGYPPEVAYPALVRVLVEQRQFEKALSEAARAQNGSSAKAELLALIGNAQLGLGKYDQARDTFSSALSLEPANETATLGMAKGAAVKRDLARAEQLVDEVLARAPSSRDALLLKGDLLLASQKDKQAVQAYEKAIELRPRSVRVYLVLVPVLLRQGDIAGAGAKVDALKKLAPRAMATLYLDALVAYKRGDRARAREAIEGVVKIAPGYVPALLLAGAIAHDASNYGAAESYLRQVVTATPNEPYPRRLLVSTYLRTGQIQQAQEALDQLLQLAPNDAATLRLAGEVYLANREVAKAANYFEKALSLDPKNALTRMRLGEAHLAAGDTQLGVQDLEAAAAADASQYAADVALLVLHLSRKELDKAQKAADSLAKKQPDNPVTYNLTGLLKLAKKDQAGARSSFQRALQLQPNYFPAARNLAILDVLDGKPDAAKQRYEAVLAKDAKNEDALLALVELSAKTGAPASEVHKGIERAVTANPGSARSRLVQVNYFMQSGDPKAAVASAQQAQAALPQNLQVLEALGRAQLAAGQNDQAIATYGKMSSLMPKSAAPLLAQGQAYVSAKDWTGARRAIQKAIELQPDVVQAWTGLVRVGLQSGRFEEARTAARAMQKRWPAQAAGYLAEVEVLIAEKDTGGAERFLRGAIDKTKNPGLVVRLYSLLDSQGRKQEAEALATGWVTQNPKDSAVDMAAGELNMQRKDYATAARWYKSALKAQPNNVVTLNNLAWVLGQLQDPAAVDYGKKALALAPKAPAVLDTLGWLYVQQGDLNRGLELLNKAHTLAPNVPSIQLNLAKALVKAGQGEAARQQLEVLAKLPAGTPIRDEAEKLLSSL